MEVLLICAADMANVDRLGKLNIIGIFQRTFGSLEMQNFNWCVVVSSRVGEKAKIESTSTIIEMMGPSGESIWKTDSLDLSTMKGQINGETLIMIIQFNGSILKSYGDYTFSVTHEGQQVARLVIPHMELE